MNTFILITTVILIIISLLIILTVRGILEPAPRKLKETFNSESRLVYSTGDSISMKDAYDGNIHPLSVFSPYNPEWYFDISGLDQNNKVVFSTGWMLNQVLRQVKPKFEDIKRWQIVVATSSSSRPSDDVYSKLRWVH